MKKAPFLIVLIAGISSLSMYTNRYSSVLDSTDYNWEKMDVESGRSALSSVLLEGEPSWKSYNQWQCFPSQGIEIQCAEEEYNGLRRVPLFHIDYGSHLYEFSMEAEPEPDCDKVVDAWKKLFQGEDSVCMYAAYLQKLEFIPNEGTDGSVWMINRIKTVKGYWSFDSEGNYAQEKRDWDNEAPEE